MQFFLARRALLLAGFVFLTVFLAFFVQSGFAESIFDSPVEEGLVQSLEAGLVPQIPVVDVNEPGEDFYFYGPEELVRNQPGAYEVHRVATPRAGRDLVWHDVTVEFVTTDELGTVVDYNVSEHYEFPSTDLNQYVFSTVFTPARVGAFTVRANIYLDGQLLPPGRSTPSEKLVRVSLPRDMLEIRSFSVYPRLEKGRPFVTHLLVRNIEPLDTNAFLEVQFVNAQNEVAQVFQSPYYFFGPGFERPMELQGTLDVPAGDYNVVAAVFFENQKKSTQVQQTVYPAAQSVILSHNIPGSVILGGTTSFSVTLQNTGPTVLRPVVHAFLSDGNSVVKTFVDSNQEVLPSQSKVVSFNWPVSQRAGVYSMGISVQSEGVIESVQRQVQVTDSTPPRIESVEFNSPVWQNGVVKVSARISDDSPIHVASIIFNYSQEILLRKISGGDYNAEFSAPITNTQMLGEKPFSILACDLYSNCSENMYSFQVVSQPANCANHVSLIVQDNDGIQFGSNWLVGSNVIPGCSVTWETRELGAPPLDFLRRFSPVFWSAGNYFGPAINDEEAGLLLQFLSSGGRLFIEGSDVSSEHAFDDFAYNVLHAEFVRERNPDENLMQVSFFDSAPNFFQLSPMALDLDETPYTDVIRPVGPEAPSPDVRAFPIAGLDENHAVVVGFQDNCPQGRLVFVSSSLSAFSSTGRRDILSESLSWLSSGEAPQTCPGPMPGGTEGEGV